MLIPPRDALHFLLVYQTFLQTVAGMKLDGQVEHLAARNLFFEGEDRDRPPTRDKDLLAALKTAVYGDFVVGRHLERGTEMVGPKDRVYRVKGLSTELAELAPSWMKVSTVVMQYRGHWICDGLIRTGQEFVGPERQAELLEIIRAATPVARVLPGGKIKIQKTKRMD